MKNNGYMDTGRLNVFYDAIIAIVATIIVLELPQPESITIAGFCQLRLSYLAYLIIFLVCVNMWQYHHKIFNHVEKINNRIIWLNILLLLVLSFIPYLTFIVADNFASLLAQMLYGINFIIGDLILFCLSKQLIIHNPGSEYLHRAIDFKNVLLLPLCCLS